MKKIIATLAAGLALCGGALQAQDELSISTTFAYESEYVFRGVFLAQGSIQPGIDISYGGAYGGIWYSFPLDAEISSKEMDVYGGYSFAVSDMVDLDVGATWYYYPNAENLGITEDNTFETYVGAVFDTTFSPAVYLYYDWDLEAITLEFSGGYSVEMGENSSFDVGPYIGYVDPDGGDSYLYGGVSADVSYSFSDNASASVGVRWAANDIDGATKDSMAWWGASFTAGF